MTDEKNKTKKETDETTRTQKNRQRKMEQINSLGFSVI
jgi:hypothetical protein